jgi:hypothetical protein
LSDLLSLFGTNNPLAAMTRSAEQFRTGVTSFVEAVQSFRQTMDNLNAVAQRMNRILDDVEQPVRTVMPQITRSAETASRMLATMREPVERVAPGLTQLADMLDNPLVADLPHRISETMEILSTIPRALSPLGQVADLAGGFFGGRGLGGFGTARPAATAASRRSDDAPVVVEAVVVEEVPAPARRPSRGTTHTAPSAQDTFRRSARKHPASREAAAERTAATNAAAKKATAKKATAKKAPVARKTATRKTASTTAAAPRKAAAKKTAPRKTASRSRSAAGR